MKKIVIGIMLLVILASSAWAGSWEPGVSIPGLAGFKSREYHTGPNLFVSASSYTGGQSSGQVFFDSDPTTTTVPFPADNCYNIPELEMFRTINISIMLAEMGDRGLNWDRIRFDAVLGQNNSKGCLDLCINNGDISFQGLGLAPGYYGFGGMVYNSLGKKQFKILFWTQAYGRKKAKDPVFAGFRAVPTKADLDEYCQNKEGCAYPDASKKCQKLALAYFIQHKLKGWDVPGVLDYNLYLESYHAGRAESRQKPEIRGSFSSDDDEEAVKEKISFHFQVYLNDQPYTGKDVVIAVKDHDDQGKLRTRKFMVNQPQNNGLLDSGPNADKGCVVEYKVYYCGKTVPTEEWNKYSPDDGEEIPVNLYQ